jgi:hypothetical protein
MSGAVPNLSNERPKKKRKVYLLHALRLFCGFFAPYSDELRRFDTLFIRRAFVANTAILRGVSEIRTREPLLTVTRFPDVDIRGHNWLIFNLFEKSC